MLQKTGPPRGRTMARRAAMARTAAKTMKGRFMSTLPGADRPGD
jgi:hypothetical protein